MKYISLQFSFIDFAHSLKSQLFLFVFCCTKISIQMIKVKSKAANVCVLVKMKCRVSLMPYYASSDRVVAGVAAVFSESLMK